MKYHSITSRLSVRAACLAVILSLAPVSYVIGAGEPATGDDEGAPGVMTPAPEAAPQSAPGEAERHEIFTYPPDFYAVQLVAFQDKSEVMGFLQRHSLGDPPYGPVDVGGKTWYVILLGVYPDRAAAERAVSQLPEDLRKNPPWIRKLGPLQEAIRRVTP